MASIDGEVKASDAGLAIILAIQVTIIFVVAPLAATNTASPQLIEGLRLGLAATTILIVARRMLTRLLIGLAFAATLAVPLHSQLGQSETVSVAARTAVTIAFDMAVAVMVAVAAFGPGRVTVHRILGGIILYLVRSPALFQLRRAHHRRQRRSRRDPSRDAQHGGAGGGDRPALSGDAARPVGVAPHGGATRAQGLAVRHFG